MQLLRSLRFNNSRTLLALVAMLITSVSVFAQQYPAPRNFTTAIKSSNSSGGGVSWNANLKWQAPEMRDSTIVVTGYNVYRFVGKSEDITKYEIVGTVTTSSNGWFQFSEEIPAGATYSYFVRATLSNNSLGERTSIKSVTAKNDNSGSSEFKFISEPPSSAKLGVVYMYTAKAVYPNQPANTTIVYSIVTAPQGISINSSTGVLTFVANANLPTSFTVKISAQLSSDPTKIIYQTWTIKISNDGGSNDNKNCVLIYGTIKDEQGTTISTSGIVRAFTLKRNDRDTNGTYVGVFTGKHVNGRYELRVKEGEYALFTEGDEYLGEWFENKTNPNDATKFTTKCGDTVKVDFVVTRRPAEVKYTFSGKVTDATTGNGLLATVVFYRRLANGVMGEAITVKTNQAGEYSIQLSNRYSYIAMASAMSQDYLAQFFDGVATPTLATILEATQNRTNINFALTQRQQYQNGFSGQLTDSSGTGIAGKVVACLITTKANEKNLNKYRTVETDANGNYTITNLEPGEYVVLGIPNVKTSSAGYYKSGALAVQQWREATRITLQQSGMVTGSIVIQLPNTSGKRGIIQIGGNVREKKGIINNPKGNGINASDNVPGVLVTVYDDENKIVDYAFSMTDGTFKLNDVGISRLKLVADHPEFETMTSMIAPPTQGFILTEDVFIQRPAVTSVEELIAGGIQLFPTPTINNAKVRFTSEESRIGEIRVLDAMGNEVLRFSVVIESGENNISINTSALPSGVYGVQLKASNRMSQIPMVIVR
jgi:hypothetical protein